MCLWGVGYCTFILIFLWSCYVSWGGGGLHCYNHFLELTFLCGGGGRTCIRLLLGCGLMWVRNTTCQIRLQTSDFIPIAGMALSCSL